MIRRRLVPWMYYASEGCGGLDPMQRDGSGGRLRALHFRIDNAFQFLPTGSVRGIVFLRKP